MLKLLAIIIYLVVGFLAGSRGGVTLLQFYLVWFNLMLYLIGSYAEEFQIK